MSEWREVSIASIATAVAGGPFGSSLGRKDYVDDGVPVIRGAQLSSDARFRLNDFVFVTEDKADRHRGNLAYRDDVIVTQRGTLGQVGIVPSDCPYSRLLLSQSQMKVTVNPSASDPHFLYYALSEPGTRQRLIEHAMTAGVPHINLATLREFTLKVPPLKTQQVCASILGAIDDLIENNQRRIALLEQMAQAIYREWFVHFRYPGHENDDLVDSPIGLIPSTWSVTTVGEHAKALVDGDWIETKDQGGQDFRLLQVSNIGVGSFRETGNYRYVTTETFERLRCTEIHRGDILISRMPDPVGRAWLVDHLTERAITAVDVAILTPPGVESGLFISQYLNSSETLAHAAAVATGTTRKRVSRSVLSRFRLALPPDSELHRFSELVSPIVVHGSLLRRQSVALSAARNLLLPMLVSGAIDVSHIDLDALLDETAA